MEIIGIIISFIIEASFEVGIFIADLLSFRKKGEPKSEMSPVKQLILSLIGGLIISLITCLVVFLIIYFTFKALF